MTRITSRMINYQYFKRFMLVVVITMFSQASLAASIAVMAVVDGFPISTIDFEQRRNFLIKTTGIDDNENTRAQIDSDVLQMLVDEVIKIKEGLSFGRSFEASARQRAKELVDTSFSQNGENPDAVLKALGIERSVAEQKFFADVLWASTVQARFAKQFSNTKGEAEKELERIKKNTAKPHINLDEIVVVPEPNRDFTTTKKLAEQIYDGLIKGADFGRIAQQYSAAGSSRSGGALGWVLLERLPERLRLILQNAPVGSFVKPIALDGSVIIYRINGRRINGKPDALETEVDLARLLYKVDLTDTAAIETGRAKVNADLNSVNTCDDLYALHQRYNGTEDATLAVDANLGRFKIAEFAPRLRDVISALAKNEHTQSLVFTEGLVAFMVCDIYSPTVTLPSLDAIEISIRNRHYAALSARLLSRLRKQSIVAYKNNSKQDKS